MKNKLIEILDNDPDKRSIESATKIYHGLSHCCRCGCGGRYFYKGEPGFKRAVSMMSKPNFKPLSAGELVYVKSHGCSEQSDGICYGSNYIDIPYNADNDKCYCIYFD